MLNIVCLTGQHIPKLTNYTVNDYNGGLQNWALTFSKNHSLYAANNQGLLAFNGQNWSLFPMENKNLIRSVFAQEDRIYSGGYEEFGYWTWDNCGRHYYHSLKDLLPKGALENEEVWHITSYKGLIFFQSFATLLVYNGKKIDKSEVAIQSLEATVDMDMVGEAFLQTLKSSFEQGKISEKQIDIACIRILKAKEDLGIIDNPFKYIDEVRAQKEILCDENRAFARKAAAASFVLLKNEKNILPLSKDKKIALIGPLADSRRNMLGTWSVSGDHEKAVTVLEGFQNNAAKRSLITHAKGANISDDKEFARRVNVFGEEITIDQRSPDAMIKEAVAVAKKADIIVAVVGEAADMSGESSSMTYIGLQPSQKKLLRALKTLGKPIVMLLYNGRPMTISEEMESMDAVLDVWFGGTEGGNAIADVIYGDVNPSGKLTTSFPVNEGQIPVYHSMLNTGRPNTEGHPKFRTNYLDTPNEPLLPFGFGLSYTRFEYSRPIASSDKMKSNEMV